MNTKYQTSLFIFRRDLRVIDNTALIEAAKLSESVIPIFIFNPTQLKNNPYRGNNLIQFMLESLADLRQQVSQLGGELFFIEGEPKEVVARLLKNYSIDAIFFNKDYTPFALKRDQEILQVANDNQVACLSFEDLLLNAPGVVLKADGRPYTVFTPFSKAAKKISVKEPEKFKKIVFSKIKLHEAKALEDFELLETTNSELYVNGGRSVAMSLLKKVASLADYKHARDLPAKSATTGLSAHNKFGTLSVREFYYEVYQSFGAEHTLIQELYWRDFFTHVAFHFPHVFKGCFHKKYDSLPWSEDPEKFKIWCDGQTGFPLVDAGMRELNATGFMHNRVRMVTASFLVKDLHINWRWGEKYFAQHLIDYDAAVNNGNWQWAASTGCDAQPYFRVFSPWRQLERFDAECEYVKRWVPELRSLTAKQILGLEKNPAPMFYTMPIVDHREAAEQIEEMFRNCK